MFFLPLGIGSTIKKKKNLFQPVKSVVNAVLNKQEIVHFEAYLESVFDVTDSEILATTIFQSMFFRQTDFTVARCKGPPFNPPARLISLPSPTSPRRMDFPSCCAPLLHLHREPFSPRHSRGFAAMGAATYFLRLLRRRCHAHTALGCPRNFVA